MSQILTHYFEKEHIIVKEYNTRKKTFSNGIVKIKKNSFSSLKGISRYNLHNGSSSLEQLDEYTKKYLKKVRSNIIDLALNFSNWEYFITLTFSDKEIGEYTHEKAIEKLKKWINNQKQQNKNFTYLLVPEFHKSGRLHFHGLIANVPKWKFEKARNPTTGRLIKINNVQIYNLVNYKLGFTTISKIQNQEKVSNYISKYATKELITLKNKKRYWYSRNLDKPKLDFIYIDNNLADYLKDNKLDYYKNFESDVRTVEIAQYRTSDNI